MLLVNRSTQEAIICLFMNKALSNDKNETLMKQFFKG